MASSPPAKLRVARPTNQLSRIVDMYCRGLNLDILARFEDHEGFDGAILATPNSPYHFEFTQQHGHVAPRSPSDELLIVLYVPDEERWAEGVERMVAAGFSVVRSHNPYWDRNGRTFEDVDGYRVVLAKQQWSL